MQRNSLIPLASLFPACLALGQSLLPDGGFEDGTVAPWGYHQEKEARATGRVETDPGATGKKALRISVAAAQGANHVQVTCPFATSALEDGEVYELTFQVRAVPPRTFSTHLIGNSRPWTNAGLREKVEAGETWQRERFLFRAVRPPQEKVKVDFFLGDRTGDVWFDDVVLSKYVSPPPSADTGGPVLTNGRCEIAFTANGAVARIRDTRSGRVLVGGMVQAPAFECELREGEETSVRSSAEAEKVELSEADGGLTCTYTYPDMIVTTTVSSVPSTCLFRCSVAIENRGSAAITSVRYPVLHAPAKLGEDSADDVFLYPRCDGGIVEDPARRFGHRGPNDTCPGPLSCQVMAFYDRTAGLYAATHDPDGFPKRFLAQLKLDLRLRVGHLLPISPGGDVALSYPVVVGTFEGTGTMRRTFTGSGAGSSRGAPRRC